MRHHHDLTDETRKTLANNCQRLAESANVSDKYMYGIMADTNTDPFAVFLSILYRPAVKAGISTVHWDARLSEIRAAGRSSRKSSVECLTEKIQRDADTTAKMVDALRDGRIDERERRAIQEAIERERQNLDLLETVLGCKAELKAVRA